VLAIGAAAINQLFVMGKKLVIEGKATVKSMFER
jgi:hypothetical protein